MKSFHALLPMNAQSALDSRYADALAHLNERHATVHLIMHHTPTARLNGQNNSLRNYQEQTERMGQYLKYETMDRQVMKIQAEYPNLMFAYHVTSFPLQQFLTRLQDDAEVQLIIIDEPVLDNFDGPEGHPLAFVQSLQDIPVWRIEDCDDDAATTDHPYLRQRSQSSLSLSN
ncbi:hypothetical protein [Reinekea sp. G2M2-21]|uniref:hypothetical protein n=1 Tax=Reinekea sp. G2M2-21 TaxID=2788942 RepID=UPI0018AAFE90|nr:hypothetical protein [Reinekea sp. G2M2-21]